MISRLTDGVEAELQRRMDDLDRRTRQTLDNLGQLSPQVEQLREGLAKVEDYLSGDLDMAIRKSSESAHDGLEHAESLRHLLGVLLARALEGNAQLASAHELSLQQASRRVNEDIGALMAVVASTAAASNALQQQIVRKS